MSSNGPNSRQLTRELLEDMYVVQKMKMQDIANHFNCSIATISKRISLFKLKPDIKFKYLNKKFGSLTVKEVAGKNKYRTTYHCQCECGKFLEVDSCSLVTGNTTSCGCVSRKRGKAHANFQGYEDIPSSMWSWIKRGAAERSLEFSISIEDAWNQFIKQNRKCALTGMGLVFAETIRLSRMGRTTASLDRIDSSKGYTIDNIQWIHKDINFMKQNYSQDYFKEMCRLVSKYKAKAE